VEPVPKPEEKHGMSAYALGYHERYSKTGYCLWEYTGGTWLLRLDRSGEGHESGGPPQGKGSYEGEIRRKSCVPKNVLDPPAE
jgi:hypothetical protein